MRKRLGQTLNYILLFSILVFILWIGYVIVWGRGGIIERRKAQHELALLQKEIAELKKEEERLDWEIRNMKYNKRYIEGYARELGYKKEGEIIFKFIDQTEKD